MNNIRKIGNNPILARALQYKITNTTIQRKTRFFDKFLNISKLFFKNKKNIISKMK